jgi:hypothetical protein
VKIPPISKAHVLEALRDLDQGINKPRFGKATKYQLEYEGKVYAPKPVVAHAVKHLTGEPLRPKDFSSGQSSRRVGIIRPIS